MPARRRGQDGAPHRRNDLDRAEHWHTINSGGTGNTLKTTTAGVDTEGCQLRAACLGRPPAGRPPSHTLRHRNALLASRMALGTSSCCACAGLVSQSQNRRTFMTNGSGVSRGDRNRNARLTKLREAVPVTNAIVGIDLADGKQMVVVCDHDSKVLARRRSGAKRGTSAPSWTRACRVTLGWVGGSGCWCG